MDFSADSSGCCVCVFLLRLNQWVVPACLVYSLRRQTQQQTKGPEAGPNPFASPFGHMGWLYFTFSVAAAATVVVTISHGFL